MSEQPSREIEITRIVDAPRDAVFAAFTDAEHLAKWWGPEGFGVSSATSDARVGGVFTIVMRGPDGVDMPVTGTYRELEPPSHLVAVSSAVGPGGEEAIEAVTMVDLADLDGKTEITLRARATGSVPEAAAMLAGMEVGWVQSLRCLDDYLTGAADRQIVLMRLLEASPEQVFEVFTTPEHVAAWWGPDGFTITIESMDVRPGGSWLFTMHGPHGVDHPNLIEYQEVTPADRLAFLHRGTPEDPTFHAVITFDRFMGNTVLTMKSVFATAADRDMVVEKYGAIEGGNQTLDRLVAYVASR